MFQKHISKSLLLSKSYILGLYMFLFRTKSILIFGITLQTYSVGFHLYKIIEFLEIQVYHLIHIFIFMYTNKHLTLLLLLPSTCWQYESAETCQ